MLSLFSTLFFSLTFIKDKDLNSQKLEGIKKINVHNDFTPYTPVTIKESQVLSRESTGVNDKINMYRDKINEINSQILDLLSTRGELAKK